MKILSKITFFDKIGVGNLQKGRHSYSFPKAINNFFIVFLFLGFTLQIHLRVRVEILRG